MFYYFFFFFTGFPRCYVRGIAGKLKRHLKYTDWTKSTTGNRDVDGRGEISVGNLFTDRQRFRELDRERNRSKTDTRVHVIPRSH